MSRRIVIAGGSGFLGSGLARQFCECGDEVIVLTRSPRTRNDQAREVAWDGKSLGDWAQFIDGAQVVINLTGKSITCVFTPENCRLIIESRVDAVRAITAAIQRTARPPEVLIQASAIGFYGDTRAIPADEASAHGTGFLAETCHAWEAALEPSTLPATRCVTLRIGVVLGQDGGALPTLARLTRWFLGGTVGDGGQFISWIHREDFNRIVSTVIADKQWQGAVNCTAPNPATNAEFMRKLRRALGRPWSPPAPALALRLFAPLLNTDATLALESQRVVPGRLLASGFQFQFPELRSALQNLLGRD